jgi:hypothetical protein
MPSHSFMPPLLQHAVAALNCLPAALPARLVRHVQFAVFAQVAILMYLCAAGSTMPRAYTQTACA